nr:MAG TPA: hypothetical protein [Caudoviricetes sp.]
MFIDGLDINELDKYFDKHFRDVNEGYGYMPTFNPDPLNFGIHPPTTTNIYGHALTKEELNKMFGDNLIRFYPKDNSIIGIYIKDVRFSPPATIVFWSDNTKTVVKAQNDEPFDAEKGLMACIIKRITGNTGRYNELFKKYIKEDK